MPGIEFESLAALLESPPSPGDGSLPPMLPTWHSFASWAGESTETVAESGISIRVSPSWYTPRWSRLDALSIDAYDDRSEDEGAGDASRPSRLTALRRTNHLVASVTRQENV